MERKPKKTALGRMIFLALCTVILTAIPTFAETHAATLAAMPKISRELVNKNTEELVDVIVQYNETPTAEHHQKVLSRGGVIKRDLGSFKGGAYRISASRLADLANDPSVRYISPDRPVKSSGTATLVPTLDHHVESIGTSAAWNLGSGLNGAGIGVAVIDSGIAAVPDLANRVVWNQDYTGQGATDQYGHGTHVAGIIAGSGADSIGSNMNYTFRGIAPGVSLISLRALDANGAGTDSQVIAAIQAAISLKTALNIRVINLSLGRPVYESYKLDPLCQAVEEAWENGIFVAVAAGNYGRDNNAGTNGYGTILAPGNDPYVMTVGAMRTEGSTSQTAALPTSYSSKGPTYIDHIVKPDISAPGNLIISLYQSGQTLSTETPSNEIPYSLYETNGSSAASPHYFILSGTSMATPMVSGAAALAFQGNPNLTPDQVKAMFMKTAFKNIQTYSTATDLITGVTYNEQADIFTVGAGYLDIHAATLTTQSQLAPPTVGSAMSPVANKNSNGTITLSPNASSVLGGSSILWGSSSVWGNSILWGSSSIASSSILWGSSGSLSGSSILWGSSTSTSASSILWGSASSQVDGVFDVTDIEK